MMIRENGATFLWLRYIANDFISGSLNRRECHHGSLLVDASFWWGKWFFFKERGGKKSSGARTLLLSTVLPGRDRRRCQTSEKGRKTFQIKNRWLWRQDKARLVWRMVHWISAKKTGWHPVFFAWGKCWLGDCGWNLFYVHIAEIHALFS